MLLIDAGYSAIASIGFAMIFNVPPKALPLCAIGGAIAHSLRTLLIYTGWGIEWSSLAAATVIGLIGVYWSRKYIIPRPVFTVASVVPLLPGTYAFKTILGIFTLHSTGMTFELIENILTNGLTTLFVLMAICFGLAIPSVVIYRFRPII